MVGELARASYSMHVARLFRSAIPPSSTRAEPQKSAYVFLHVGSEQRHLTASSLFTYKESRSEHAYCEVFESQLYYAKS
jgi:hypothetical protein